MNTLLLLSFLSLFSFFSPIIAFEVDSNGVSRDGDHDRDRVIDQHQRLVDSMTDNLSQDVEDYVNYHGIDRHLASLMMARFSNCLSGEQGVAIIDSLIESGADVNITQNTDSLTPLMNAECPEVAESLIAYGANVNSVNYYGATALIIYANNLDEEVALPLVRLLLDNQADKSIRDSSGQTALNCAVERDLYSIVELLS